MSSEEEEDKGSQRTQQQNESNNRRGAKGHGTRYKMNITGDIKELGNKVYTYGNRNQGDWYIKTTEAVAEYVGRVYNKEMRMLVKEKKESEPEEPEKPSDTKNLFCHGVVQDRGKKILR